MTATVPDTESKAEKTTNPNVLAIEDMVSILLEPDLTLFPPMRTPSTDTLKRLTPRGGGFGSEQTRLAAKPYTRSQKLDCSASGLSARSFYIRKNPPEYHVQPVEGEGREGEESPRVLTGGGHPQRHGAPPDNGATIHGPRIRAAPAEADPGGKVPARAHRHPPHT